MVLLLFGTSSPALAVGASVAEDDVGIGKSSNPQVGIKAVDDTAGLLRRDVGGLIGLSRLWPLEFGAFDVVWSTRGTALHFRRFAGGVL